MRFIEADHQLSGRDPEPSSVISSPFDYPGENWGGAATPSALVIPTDAAAPENLGHKDSELEKRDNQRQPTWGVVEQRHASWNLQMICSGTQLNTPVVNGTGSYEFLDGAGKGVDIYIFDSGIRLTHRGFGGRAKNIYGVSPSSRCLFCGNPDSTTMEDFTGHGTA